ncbi:MAG: dimethyl sulfoxide reductase anchor subunit [Campylobacteraceae bacterium]|nr:dimethyl sulfoxide reductase anchor subunit [Campylobacteraceae bacterium]
MSLNTSTPLESFLSYKADTKGQCGNYSIDIQKPKEGEQYRFHFDANACIGCHCCEVACNEQNANESDVKWRRVGESTSGTFPDVAHHFNSMSCNHCIDPECLKGCPTSSYIKFDNGIVFHEDETCIGCQYCTWNCPYEVPVFNKDRGIVTKCDMCHDKLEIGQTPACVQSCPSNAIQIEIVNIKTWQEKDMYKDGVAPHLCDVNITKPTTRYTLKENKGNIKTADDHIIKANHSEWPLVFMTILSQISLGSFLTLTIIDLFNFYSFELSLNNIYMILAAFLPAAIGLPLSALHLGRPILAFTAIKNIKTSWLSREALALGIYTLGMSILIIVYFLELNKNIKLLSEIIILLIGIYGIYAQSMIYRIKARPSWNKKETNQIFFSVGYIGIFLSALVLILSEEYTIAIMIIPFATILAFCQFILSLKQDLFYRYLDKNDKNFYQLNKTKILYENKFNKENKLRKIILLISTLLFPILIIYLLEKQEYKLSIVLLILTLVMSFISEIISRSLFYKTAVAHGLEGNFFAGSQR